MSNRISERELSRLLQDVIDTINAYAATGSPRYSIRRFTSGNPVPVIDRCEKPDEIEVHLQAAIEKQPDYIEVEIYRNRDRKTRPQITKIPVKKALSLEPRTTPFQAPEPVNPSPNQFQGLGSLEDMKSFLGSVVDAQKEVFKTQFEAAQKDMQLGFVEQTNALKLEQLNNNHARVISDKDREIQELKLKLKTLDEENETLAQENDELVSQVEELSKNLEESQTAKQQFKFSNGIDLAEFGSAIGLSMLRKNHKILGLLGLKTDELQGIFEDEPKDPAEPHEPENSSASFTVASEHDQAGHELNDILRACLGFMRNLDERNQALIHRLFVNVENGKISIAELVTLSEEEVEQDHDFVDSTNLNPAFYSQEDLHH